MKKQAIARGVQIALVLALSMGQALDAKRVTRPVAPHKVTITLMALPISMAQPTPMRSMA